VNDDETFSAQLQKLTGRTVINAGVPTYGLEEYLRVAVELIKSRHPSVVVLVINYANDPFELNRPNTQRQQSLGWLGPLRAETAPARVFPFQVVSFCSDIRMQYLPFVNSGMNSLQKRRSPLICISLGRVVAGFLSRRRECRKATGAGVCSGDRSSRIRMMIFVHCDSQFAECGRFVDRTAKDLVRAAQELEKLEKNIANIGSLKQENRPAEPHYWWFSPFDDILHRFENLAQAYGASPIVLLLPMDVQVSSEEWLKYGVTSPLDMSPTLKLLPAIWQSVTK